MSNTNHVGRYEDLGECKYDSDFEERYDCPYCLKLRGKEDTNAKLYYNKVKRVGICFKCGSIVLNDSLRSADEIRRLFNIKNKDYLQDSIVKYDKQKLRLGNWTSLASQVKYAKDYMFSRGIYSDTLDRFNIMCRVDENRGIVFINKYESNMTDFFQIRNLDSDLRHNTLKGLVRPVSWLCHVSKKAILVEGFTSGLSISQSIPEYTPIVTTGKSITKFQLYQLKQSSVTEIVICYDGGFIKETLIAANILYKNLPDTEVSLMNLPRDKDPNDLSEVQLKALFDSRAIYDPSRVNLIKKKFYNL